MATRNQAENTQLLRDIQRYKIHDDPFDVMPCNGELVTLKLWWKSIALATPQAELPKLALLMLDIKPHAADPKRIVSLMG